MWSDCLRLDRPVLFPSPVPEPPNLPMFLPRETSSAFSSLRPSPVGEMPMGDQAISVEGISDLGGRLAVNCCTAMLPWLP